MSNLGLTLDGISERLTAAGIEHLCTLQHLMTNKPIVVWECDLRTGEVFLQHTNPPLEDSPEVQQIVIIGAGS
jgi:hypothetical protein